MRHLHALRLASLAAVVVAFACKLPIGEDSKTPAGVNLIINNPATTNNFQISFGNIANSVPGSYQVQITATAVGVSSPLPVTLTLNIS